MPELIFTGYEGVVSHAVKLIKVGKLRVFQRLCSRVHASYYIPACHITLDSDCISEGEVTCRNCLKVMKGIEDV